MNINNVNKLISGVSPKSNDKSDAGKTYRTDSASSAGLKPHGGNTSEVANSKAAQIQQQLPEVRPEMIANATEQLESGQFLTRASAVKTAEAILGY